MPYPFPLQPALRCLGQKDLHGRAVLHGQMQRRIGVALQLLHLLGQWLSEVPTMRIYNVGPPR
jgi:hypothetical protein